MPGPISPMGGDADGDNEIVCLNVDEFRFSEMFDKLDAPVNAALVGR